MMSLPNSNNCIDRALTVWDAAGEPHIYLPTVKRKYFHIATYGDSKFCSVVYGVHASDTGVLNYATSNVSCVISIRKDHCGDFIEFFFQS